MLSISHMLIVRTVVQSVAIRIPPTRCHTALPAALPLMPPLSLHRCVIAVHTRLVEHVGLRRSRRALSMNRLASLSIPHAISISRYTLPPASGSPFVLRPLDPPRVCLLLPSGRVLRRTSVRAVNSVGPRTRHIPLLGTTFGRTTPSTSVHILPRCPGCPAALRLDFYPAPAVRVVRDQSSSSPRPAPGHGRPREAVTSGDVPYCTFWDGAPFAPHKTPCSVRSRRRPRLEAPQEDIASTVRRLGYDEQHERIVRNPILPGCALQGPSAREIVPRGPEPPLPSLPGFVRYSRSSPEYHQAVG
ncbi:hypothetical protein C8Q76DRAFT_68670 [Earliella scabrosa]|nr:hypothetical protein C8Q76DRAFT_68670 [Earliella scabrosa]